MGNVREESVAPYAHEVSWCEGAVSVGNWQLWLTSGVNS